MSQAAGAAISKRRRVAFLKHFWFGWHREHCRDIVGTDSGAVRRPNKASQCAGCSQGNETRAVRHLGGTGSTKYARSAETFRAQIEVLSGTDKQSFPTGEATVVRTTPAGPRQQIGLQR